MMAPGEIDALMVRLEGGLQSTLPANALAFVDSKTGRELARIVNLGR